MSAWEKLKGLLNGRTENTGPGSPVGFGYRFSDFGHVISQPLRAKVSRVSILPRGGVSVVLRFEPIDRDKAQQLTPGTIVAISSDKADL
jgi:hypothetical protein